jgi:hypothetical protein
MEAFLIYGLSGTGKSSVGKALAAREYRVIETDNEQGMSTWINKKSGLKIPLEEARPPHTVDWLNDHSWDWDETYIHRLLDDATEQYVFFCGGANNARNFYPLFTKMFALVVDDATMKQRLQTREPERWADGTPELERMLAWNNGYVMDNIVDKPLFIDARNPVEEVADDILKHVHG